MPMSSHLLAVVSSALLSGMLWIIRLHFHSSLSAYSFSIWLGLTGTPGWEPCGLMLATWAYDFMVSPLTLESLAMKLHIYLPILSFYLLLWTQSQCAWHYWWMAEFLLSQPLVYLYVCWYACGIYQLWMVHRRCRTSGCSSIYLAFGGLQGEMCTIRTGPFVARLTFYKW